MDNAKIGNYIQNQRKAAKLTQKELAEKLNISFQAVSKWETGESLPDTGILLELCEALGTTVDRLLNGGEIVPERRVMRVQDVMEGFQHMEAIGKCFGENCTFYKAMIDGINNSMNMDIIEYLHDPNTRQVMYAEVIIQGILEGRTIDIDEVDALFSNKHMVDMIRKYLENPTAKE